MNILVIDTASPLEIIAACNRAGDVAISSPVNTSHSATILHGIDGSLGKLGLSPSEIDCLGVGVGPGSFTGIRIAVSTARMLAQVLGKPLVGVKTHLLYAISVDAQAGDSILIAFDAKKGRVFGALYRRGADLIAPDEIVPPGDYEIQRLVEAVDPTGATFLIGDGVLKYADAVSTLERGVILRDFTPSGSAICGLVRETYRKNPEAYGNYTSVVPCYARKSDAEAAKDLKKKT
ncbi:MAG: tRNA (adenosine(37)-N6)-threonylcarbamoyltransferase complex dimerization subunit type 1 TsaB [Spirochaetes bacterium]|nr:tRNA (adenosine(37)-N6)-threonylcarbamoyltransferase complex dimerization subunit type 1 TsaB [Spirochaetota bacterium]